MRNIVERRWRTINSNRAAMEEAILKLMANPATEAEHLAQAHALYANVCKALAEASYAVDHVLRTGKRPTEPMFPEVQDIKCSCGHEFKFVRNDAGVRCPACGMY